MQKWQLLNWLTDLKFMLTGSEKLEKFTILSYEKVKI